MEKVESFKGLGDHEKKRGKLEEKKVLTSG
jgi:hypothetical protein